MRQGGNWRISGLMMCILSIGIVPAYADFGHAPIHTGGPVYGEIADLELVTFEATVDHVQLPVLIVSDEQTVQWTIYAGSLHYWEDLGYSVEVGDDLTVTGAALVYGMGPGAGSGMHNGGALGFQAVSPHFVVFSIDNHTTGRSMSFRDPDTGVPLWRNFGPHY